MVLSLPVNRNHPWHTSVCAHTHTDTHTLGWCESCAELLKYWWLKSVFSRVITDGGIIHAHRRLTRVHKRRWSLLRQFSILMERDRRFLSPPRWNPARAPHSSRRPERLVLGSVHWCSSQITEASRPRAKRAAEFTCRAELRHVTRAPLCHDNCTCRACHLLFEATKGGGPSISSSPRRWCLSEWVAETCTSGPRSQRFTAQDVHAVLVPLKHSDQTGEWENATLCLIPGDQPPPPTLATTPAILHSPLALSAAVYCVPPVPRSPFPLSGIILCWNDIFLASYLQH